MQQFSFLVSADQYTEYPDRIAYVEERLGWVRNWSSWRGFNLTGLPIEHTASLEAERDARTSYLVTGCEVTAESANDGARIAYETVNRKLNLLSLITGKGFIPITVGVPTSPTRQDRRANLVKKAYWWVSKQAEVKTDQTGKGQADSWPGQRKTVAVEKPGYQHEEFEIAVDIREQEPKRQLWQTTIAEVEHRWTSLTETVAKLPPGTMPELSRALDFYRVSRMSRDLFARYVVVWVALDSLTPFTEGRGRDKINGMAKHMGAISGVENLGSILTAIYSTRNDIAHSKELGEDFAKTCKSRLIMLEWVFVCYLHERLGLPQRPPNGVPMME